MEKKKSDPHLTSYAELGRHTRSLAQLVSLAPSVSRGGSRCRFSSRGMVLRPSRAYRTSWGCCICLVSFSNSLSKRWLVRRSVSISYWCVWLLKCLREVGYLCRLAGLASLGDYRGSCLCSRLIPSVTERSVLFVKVLLFP